ncbi:unnamed protein product [Linum tenue]|uniref:SGS domain-containing protein n=1 Tax=Linum tenue TaxID=586396 RepID=A0AAV0NX22_9ROSI|nr:unnamed protein product [Linum tenue]
MSLSILVIKLYVLLDKCKNQVSTTKIEMRLPKMNLFCEHLLIISQRPAYPSLKSRDKDWDKLEALVKKEEKDEKLDGDAALDKFSSEIYGNDDEDMRRAMSKYLVESNGTMLSTN